MSFILINSEKKREQIHSIKNPLLRTRWSLKRDGIALNAKFARNANSGTES